ncbi:MAG: imidazolonepropionase [Elusimicrobia bacterium RBG_16_66_12]|nr:MAG: imidazolonepropionase [Elusimicrobia bacterium RBG_16_66_12]
MAGSDGPRAGREKGAVSLFRDGAVLIEDGRIVTAGPRDVVLAHPLASGARRLSAEGRVVTPGFVDAHTHPVFTAPRLDDFEARVGGAGYRDLAARGGGILWTVNGVRGASEADLAAGLSRRAFDFLACGTTTLEAKSGYGLDLDNELKLLRAIRTVAARGPLEIVPTLLGAHAVPPEMKGRKDEYVARVCSEMIPRAAAEGLARFVDLFCEDGYFDLADLAKIASAGASAGLGLKVHSEQLTRMGSLSSAVKLHAVSVDHLDHANEDDVSVLAASRTVACLVPGSNYFLGKPYPPARRLLDAGAAVALATDFNPGTCPCWDMRAIMSIACTQMKMTPGEAMVAATVNGAHAAGLGKTHGTLEPGKAADLVCHDAEDWREIAYYFGAPRTRWTMKRGEVVASLS